MTASAFDVVCAGAGPAGALLALELQRRGYSVVLIDAGRRAAPCGEHVSPRTRLALESVARWKEPPPDLWLDSHGIDSSWGGRAPEHQDYLFDPHGHGAHLDRVVLDETLRTIAVAAGATLIASCRVASVSSGARGGWVVRAIERGAARTFRGRFLVDATGRSARVGRLLRARRRRADRLVALMAHVQAAPSEVGSEPARLVIEAVEAGWWYLTRLPGDRCTVARLSDPDLLPKRGRRRDGALRRWLSETELVSAALPAPSRPPSVVVRNADTAWLHPACGHRWLAVGDAAFSSDPLAANGIASACLGAQHGAAAIAEALAGRRTWERGHDEWLKGRVTSFLAERREMYSAVTRWPTAPFWQRRQRDVVAR